MFRKISLKTKMIIFIAASIVGISIIMREGIYNRRHEESMSQNSKETHIITSADENDNRNKVEQSQNNKKQSNTHNELEEKYKKAYQDFHGKKYPDAIKICDDIIKKDADYYKAYNIKGIALCYSGRYEEGMKNIDKSLEIDSDFGYARFNKALAYELYGHYDEAIKWYNKNLEIEKYIWSYYGLASIYGRRGDADNTVKYLKIAIDMDKSVKEVARDEKDFDNVKNNTEFKKLIK